MAVTEPFRNMSTRRKAALSKTDHASDTMNFAEISPLQIPPSLLLEADPSAANIATYLLDSWCFGVLDKENVVGACVVTPEKSHVAELSNLAISPDLQGKNWGTRLMRYVLTSLKARDIKRIELGTGTFGYQLAFYQRLGFRVESVVKNHFLDNYEEPVWENGIQHKDMLRLYLDL